ncbi:HNH endonuclease [Aeromicrobium piscarium]
MKIDGRWRTLAAHRVSLLIAGVELIPGRVVDHICRVRRCVNPEHLRQLTNRDNILAGVGATAINARKTHCKRGHEYTPENTYQGNRGRECRECRANRIKARSRLRRPCPECGVEISANHMSKHIKLIHGKSRVGS